METEDPRGGQDAGREAPDVGADRGDSAKTPNAGELIALPATEGVPARARPGAGPLEAYLASLGERSQRTMRIALDRIARLFGERMSADDVPWEQLRHQHVAAIRSRLASGGYAPATANASLAALRGVLKAAWRLDLMTTDDYHRAIDVKHLPGTRLPAGRALDAGELSALLRSCADEDSPAGRRDAAMIALLAGAGLRRSEASALQVGDYDDKEESVTVIGKGDKERRVFLMVGGGALIDEWLDVRGRQPGPLLLKVSKVGRITYDDIGLSDQAIMLRVAHRSRRLGIACTPHDLRRSYITLLLEAGADVLSVQRLAGHASMQTTSLYDARPDREARKAARSVRLL